MTKVNLQQRPYRVRETSSWFLPGDDATAWLEVCAECDVPTQDIRFYVVADSLHNKVAGALILAPAKLTMPPGSRAQAYGELRPGFYLPVDAELSPPMAEAELAAAVHYPLVIFHPAHGLSGFDSGSERRAWDLLQPLARNADSWNRARAVEPANLHLRSIRIEALISIEEIFGEESRDIGSDNPENLPPTSSESNSSLPSRAAQAAATFGAQALAKLLSLVPRTPGIAPTWVNHLETWAAGKLAKVARNLDQERHKELHRLLEMLAEDPEKGLRHAISLANLQSRGRAPPSSRLGHRSLDFNLRRLGGGMPADSWSVPITLQSQLVKSYREMAQRETKLGRHRRAACIYAELLGDFSSAAGALKMGRHFPEAALLYQERLNSPLVAAECFAEGGLLHEAIAILEKHNRWVEVSELYLRLGAGEAAERALRRAVEARLAEGDVVKAAELLEKPLNVPDEALALLATTWPGGRQALQALEARFALLQRLHRFDQARALIKDLAEESIPLSRVSSVIGILAQVAEKSTADPVRSVAAEAIRGKASPVLTRRLLEPAEEIAVLRALARLAPEDRLLVRDVTRFREERKAASTTPVRKSLSDSSRALRIEKRDLLKLPSGGSWIRVLGDSLGFCAVARLTKPRLFFSRGSWKGALQSADWDDPAPEMGATLTVTAHANQVVLTRPFAEGFAIKHLPAADAFNWLACDVGTPDWWPKDAVQVASSRFTLWIVRIVTSRVILASYQNGNLIYSRDVTDELIAAGATGTGTALNLDAQGGAGRVALAYGQHLLILENRRELTVRDLGSRVIRLLRAPGSHPGWLALLERGAVFVPADGNSVIELDDSMEAPWGIVLQNGVVMLASGEEARLLELDTPRALSLGRFSLPGGPGIALTVTDKSDEFAVFHENGVMQKWSFLR